MGRDDGIPVRLPGMLLKPGKLDGKPDGKPDTPVGDALGFTPPPDAQDPPEAVTVTRTVETMVFDPSAPVMMDEAAEAADEATAESVATAELPNNDEDALATKLLAPALSLAMRELRSIVDAIWRLF